MNLYCVRDRKANLCHRPVSDRDHVQAIRAFELSCRNPDSQFAQWPGDFELLFLGTFDVQTGRFKQDSAPLVVLADATQFPARKPEVMNPPMDG